MKVDHAPASEPTIGAKICTALVSTVECVIPSLTKSLRLEPRDFGEILPEWYVHTTRTQSTAAAKKATALPPGAQEDLHHGPQHVASKAA